MSSSARKSGDRTIVHRGQEHLTVSRLASAQNSIGWDEEVRIDPNAVFIPVMDTTEFIDRMERCIEQAKLDKLDHRFLDGGVLVRFRRKHDADVFREIIAE